MPTIIAICGGSASGKTTVARDIAAKLQGKVRVLSLDSFYKTLTPEQHLAALRGEHDFDQPDAIDFELLHQVLEQLQIGNCANVPCYDFVTHQRTGVTRIEPADFVVFEGLFAFDQRIAHLAALRVFIDTDDDVRLVRRILRDTAERGHEIEPALWQYLKFVKPAFEQHIRPMKRLAHVIVPSDTDNQIAASMICNHLVAL